MPLNYYSRGRAVIGPMRSLTSHAALRQEKKILQWCSESADRRALESLVSDKS